MKRLPILFLLFVLTSITTFVACRKDLSTLDLNKIPPVLIDTVGNSTLSVYQFEHLVVKPNLNIVGISESDLSFKWRINLAPSDTNWIVIGETRDLDYEVKFKPNLAGKFHRLFYTVTDNKSGIAYNISWPVTVKNNIGEGLLVAETNDNINTDISHIMSPEVTTAFSKVEVKHHVYSSINGNTIPGIVKQMRFTKIFGIDAFYAITDNSITRVNTLDHTFAGKDNDLFFAPYTVDIKPQALGGVYLGDVFIINNQFTSTNIGVSRKIGAPYDNKFVIPTQVAMNGNNSEYSPVITFNFYDETNGHFVYLPTITPFGGDTKMHAHPGVSGGAFNPGSMVGKKNLAAGITVDRGFLHVLKDKSTNATEVYIFDGGSGSTPVPAPLTKYDISNAPGINEATMFVILDDQRVMYYATPKKIYAMVYGTATPVFEERYTVPANESITTLQIYQQVGYPLSYDPYIATNNKQLIMSTYGTEGKVYLLPMKNLGAGNIDQPNIKTFTGFGRITAITPQK